MVIKQRTTAAIPIGFAVTHRHGIWLNTYKTDEFDGCLVYPERLCVYHAGTPRVTFLACLKVSTLFIFTFFAFVVTPMSLEQEGFSNNALRSKCTSSFRHHPALEGRAYAPPPPSGRVKKRDRCGNVQKWRVFGNQCADVGHPIALKQPLPQWSRSRS